MKKWLNALSSWPALIVWCGILALTSWGWAKNMVSYFWLTIGVTVGVLELVSKIWTGKTITSNTRKAYYEKRLKFWLNQIAWIGFAITLSLHFTKPFWMGFFN
jgi:hypothetical protein